MFPLHLPQETFDMTFLVVITGEKRGLLAMGQMFLNILKHKTASHTKKYLAHSVKG